MASERPYFRGGAAGGFVAGFIASGGNLKAGLAGAAMGAAMGYFGGLSYYGDATEQAIEKGVVEGIVGGVVSAAVGGTFESGFLGAFVGAAVGGSLESNISGESAGAVAERTTIAAVLGGTVSELNGGSFANGAWSAAFQHLFNETAHKILAYKLMMKKYGSVIRYGHININADIKKARHMSLRAFINANKTNGTWDYKDSAKFDGFKNRALLAEFGNFHFGIVAHAFGYTLGMAVAGAGSYQTFMQGYHTVGGAFVGRENFAYSTLVTGPLFFTSDSVAAFEINYMGVRFGDNPDDTPVVEAGYDYYGG